MAQARHARVAITLYFWITRKKLSEKTDEIGL